MKCRIKNQESRIKGLTFRTFRYLTIPFLILSATSAMAADSDIKLTLPPSIGTNTDNYGTLIMNIIGLIFAFLAASAFVGIVYSGLMMITAGGDAAKFATGRKNLIWSIIGIIVVTLAYFILRFVGSLTEGLIK